MTKPFPRTSSHESYAGSHSLTLHNQGDFGTCSVHAACTVIQDNLIMRYGRAIDEADFVSKVTSHGDGYAGISPERMVEVVNTQSATLKFKDAGNARLFRLRLCHRTIKSFEELQQLVRSMPGTACAVANVKTNVKGHGLHAVPVFREGYGAPGVLVGRNSWGTRDPLCRFSAAEFRGALVLQPEIIEVLRYDSTTRCIQSEPIPCASEEYLEWGKRQQGAMEYGAKQVKPTLHLTQNLRGSLSLLQAGESPDSPIGKRFDLGSRLQGQLADSEALEPTEEGMRRVSAALQDPDATADNVCAFLKKLRAWMHGSDGSSLEARTAFHRASGHPHLALVVTLQRFSADVEVARRACAAIACAAWEHPGNVVCLVDSGVVEAVCVVMQRHPADVTLQRKGIAAQAVIAFHGGGHQAVAAGAVDCVLQGMAAHVASADVQASGCVALRSFVTEGGSPAVGMAAAARRAIDAHPHDEKVRRDAGVLLITLGHDVHAVRRSFTS